MEKEIKLKSIFVGVMFGFLVGVILSSLFVSQFFRIIIYNIPFVGVFVYNADIFWLRILLAVLFLIFGGIIGLIIGSHKKEVTPPTLGTWLSLILSFILLFGFYIFTFTVTYECSVATLGKAQERDGCYSNRLVCNKVNNQNLRDGCYVVLAQYKADLEICNNIISFGETNRCVALVAGQKSNPNICEKISDQTDKDFCYYAAASSKNPEICEKISGQSAKNSCYFTIGTQLCDESICQKIIDIVGGNLKLDCLAAVARNPNC